MFSPKDHLRPSCLIALALVLALGSGCPKEVDENEEQDIDCETDSDCPDGGTCFAYTCESAAKMEARRQKWKREREHKRLAAIEKEARLLRESGLEIKVEQQQEPPTQLSPALNERPDVLDDGPCPGCVRVVHTKGLSPIFAACRPDERLIGGGCESGTSSISVGESYPSNYSQNDTIGARWNCAGRSNYVEKEMEAYALCQQTGKGK